MVVAFMLLQKRAGKFLLFFAVVRGIIGGEWALRSLPEFRSSIDMFHNPENVCLNYLKLRIWAVWEEFWRKS